jgi:hypothetical protein
MFSSNSVINKITVIPLKQYFGEFLKDGEYCLPLLMAIRGRKLETDYIEIMCCKHRFAVKSEM